MEFDTVYYSRFWYSRFLNARLSNFDANMERNSSQIHIWHLRLLSVLFPRIYIPRTHLITTALGAQANITEEVLKSDEFKFLVDVGSICVSTLPGLDAGEDNERIACRRGETESIGYADSATFKALIPKTRSYDVLSNKESANNKVSFPKYAALFDVLDPELARTLKDEISRSHLRDVPFFHEAFAMNLRRKLDPVRFERVWRDTNSRYLMSPVPSEAGLVAYFDIEIEAPGYRFQDGIDRFLFSPEAIYTFMEGLMEYDQLMAFLHEPITRTHRFLASPTYKAQLVKAFRKEYFSIARQISHRLVGPKGYLAPTPGELRPLFEAVMSSNIEAFTDSISKISSEIKSISEAGSLHQPGLVAGAVQMAAKYGGKWLARQNRAARFPGIMQFMADLRLDLDPQFSA